MRNNDGHNVPRLKIEINPPFTTETANNGRIEKVRKRINKPHGRLHSYTLSTSQTRSTPSVMTAQSAHDASAPPSTPHLIISSSALSKLNFAAAHALAGEQSIVPASSVAAVSEL